VGLFSGFLNGGMGLFCGFVVEVGVVCCDQRLEYGSGLNRWSRSNSVRFFFFFFFFVDLWICGGGWGGGWGFFLCRFVL
jgi:hypothetical protein